MYKGFTFILLLLSYYFYICSVIWIGIQCLICDWQQTMTINKHQSSLFFILSPALRFTWFSVWMPSTQMAAKPKKSITLLPCIIYQLTAQQSWAAVRETPPATCSCHSTLDFEVRQKPLILFYFPASLPAAAWRFDSVEHEGRCWWGRGKAVTPAGSASPRMAGLTCKGGGKGETRRSRPCLRKGWPGLFTGWQLLKACRLQSTRGGGGGSWRRRSGLRARFRRKQLRVSFNDAEKGMSADFKRPFVVWGRSIWSLHQCASW